MNKKQLINNIINNMRAYELDLMIDREKNDSPRNIAIKIENEFSSYTISRLKPIYNKIKWREKYNNIGLIA